MTVSPPPPPLGPVLVVGGCGFLGWHLVGHLLRDPSCTAVYVVDRAVDRNVHADAVYLTGDMTDAASLGAILEKLQPRVVFHAASPLASLPGHRWGEYARTNIDGTRALLALARDQPSVRALVYTSSIDVYARPPHERVSEAHPLWDPRDASNEYNRTKAVGDALARAANGPRLRTACARLGHAYGERQSQGLVEVLDMCAGGGPLVQVGDGRNLMEVVSGANSATGHVLLAKALLEDPEARVREGRGRVDGEAFNISDGAPVPFWHHVRVIWGVARGKDALGSVIVLPAWIMVAVVVVVEWALWLATLDRVKPPVTLRRTALEYCIYPHTYTTDKARTRLGFEPVVDHDAVLARAARLKLDEMAAAKVAKVNKVD